MGLRSKDNLSLIVSSIGKNNSFPIQSKQIGKVYGVVTVENTPTPAMFKKAGGFDGMGTIFYLDYDNAKEIPTEADDNFLNSCLIARPQYPYNKYYPLIGELVIIQDKLPSPFAQVSSVSDQKYYTVLNLWNNPQQNNQPGSRKDSTGITFVSNPNARPLLSFEGDSILEGRQGNSIRFSSTTKLYNDLNQWSSIGNEDSPILILTNGLAFDPNKKYYVEQINQDSSSIYLTTSQKISLQTDKNGVLNNLTNPINASDYSNSQVIINSDRVTLNSKKDEVMIFAKTNVEINTKNIINLNADERVHLNSKAVFLGPFDANNTPQPLLLGNNTYILLSSLLDGLYSFGTALSAVVGSPEGAPAIDINTAAEDLLNTLDIVTDQLGGILSQQNFTV